MIYQLICFVWLLVCFMKTYCMGFYFLLRQLLQKHVVAKGLCDAYGKVAIVTGGASGIGFYVSQKLAARKIHVIIAGTRPDNNDRAVQEILRTVPDAKVQAIQLDLASFRSVERFADAFLALNLPLNILVNNAGVMTTPYSITEDGLEGQAQVNYFGHFYLIQLLLGKLRESGKDNSWSRIVNVSSCAHMAAGTLKPASYGKRVDFWYEYSSHKAYCESKLANILNTYQLHHLLTEDNSKVAVSAVHPGIVRSGLTRHLHWFTKAMVAPVETYLYKNAEQGAECTVYAALSSDLEGKSGGYYDNCEEVRSSAVSYSRKLQQELWEMTVQTVGSASQAKSGLDYLKYCKTT